MAADAAAVVPVPGAAAAVQQPRSRLQADHLLQRLQQIAEQILRGGHGNLRRAVAAGKVGGQRMRALFVAVRMDVELRERRRRGRSNLRLTTYEFP